MKLNVNLDLNICKKQARRRGNCEHKFLCNDCGWICWERELMTYADEFHMCPMCKGTTTTLYHGGKILTNNGYVEQEYIKRDARYAVNREMSNA
jgi:hypothetical protein